MAAITDVKMRKGRRGKRSPFSVSWPMSATGIRLLFRSCYAIIVVFSFMFGMETCRIVSSHLSAFTKTIAFLPAPATLGNEVHPGLDSIAHDPNRTADNSLPLKQVLFYNTWWGKTDFFWGFGQEPFSKCRIKSCFASSKSVHSPSVQDMSNFDAVLIHGAEFNLDVQTNDYIRSWRKPHQRFVFLRWEPPPIGPQFTSPDYNFFWNYTMTYRLDSDFPLPYAFVAPNVDRVKGGDQRAVQTPVTDWEVDYDAEDFFANILPNKGDELRRVANKSKKVAWVVSRCKSNSRREEFVEELKKYIDVDIYGKCGNTTCSKDEKECFSTMRDYKFYLAFENNFARDYVTEKFFRRMNDGFVPIALGQANYSILAPPHSFINVFDYSSPKALAEVLHRLDKNDTEYLSYFWWKDHYHVELRSSSFCDLCAKLHEDDKPSSYPDFGRWWHTDSHIGQKLPDLIFLLGKDVPTN